MSEDSPTMTDTTSASTRRRNDLIFTAAVIVLAAAGVAFVARQSLDDWDMDYKNVTIFVSIAAAAILIGGWFWFRSEIPFLWKFVVPIAVVAGFFLVFRLEDFHGDMGFRLALRFAKKPDELLAAATSGGTVEGLDFASTTTTDYPSFLGKDARATVTGLNLDTDWDTNPPQRVWRQPIGAGWSAFAIVGRYAVTQEQRGEDELVVCYGLSSGKIIWSHADKGRFSELLGGDGPRATPTIYEGKVYALGAFGILNCLDGATGKKLWSRDVMKETGAAQLHWGRSTSPLVVDDKVFISAGGPDGKSMVAYDAQSGEPIWSAGDDRASYATPTYAELAGVLQIVVVNEDFVVGHRLTDGKVLWKHEWPGNSDANANTSNAVPLGNDQLFLSKGYAHGSAVIEIKPGKTDDALEVTVVQRKSSVMKTKMTNVVIHNGHVYGLSGGFLECARLSDLQRCWKKGRYGHGQIMLIDDTLLIVTEKGEVVLVAATPVESRELARFQAIEGKTWNNPAVSGRFLLIRNHLEAACYKLPVNDSDT